MTTVTRRAAGLAVLGLAAAVLGPMAARADTPADGKAEGTLTVNGKTVKVGYAYALMVPGFFDPATKDIRVIVSDAPLDGAALADDFVRIGMAKEGKLHAFEITINAEGKPISTAWRHDGFKGPMPSGLSSEDVFTKTVLDGKLVEASYKSAGDTEFFDDTYSFDVTFRAPIAP